MDLREGLNDFQKRAPRRGRPPGIKESEKRAAAGAERAPSAGRPPGIKESKSRAAGAGGSNHQLPQTKSKKMVVDGWSRSGEGHYKEALALFEEATVVDPSNGDAFLSVSKLQWKLRYILTNGDISNDEMQRCLSSAEESQRLGWEGAEAQVMYLRLLLNREERGAGGRKAAKQALAGTQLGVSKSPFARSCLSFSKKEARRRQAGAK